MPLNQNLKKVSKQNRLKKQTQVKSLIMKKK